MERDTGDRREVNTRLYLFVLVYQVQDQREKSPWTFKKWAGAERVAGSVPLFLLPREARKGNMWGLPGQSSEETRTSTLQLSLHSVYFPFHTLFQYLWSFPFCLLSWSSLENLTLATPKGLWGPFRLSLLPIQELDVNCLPLMTHFA